MNSTPSPSFTCSVVETDRLATNVWTSGPDDGAPVLLVLPSQPMVAQMRAVLERYAANGGDTREVPLEGIGHGIPLEVPGRVAEEVVRALVR